MKKTARALPLILVLLLLPAMIASAGCTSIAPAKGDYKVLSINAAGPEQYFEAGNENGIVLPEDYAGPADEFILLSLKSDGSASFTLFGKTRTGSWSESGDDVTVELEDGETLHITRLRTTASLMYVYCGAEIVLSRR